MNVFSEKSLENQAKALSKDRASRKPKGENPKKISVDPLYDSTDKYRRIYIPNDMEELISSDLKA